MVFDHYSLHVHANDYFSFVQLIFFLLSIIYKTIYNIYLYIKQCRINKFDDCNELLNLDTIFFYLHLPAVLVEISNDFVAKK